MPREKIFDKLIPAQFQIEPRHAEILAKISYTRKISKSALIRELIEIAAEEKGINTVSELGKQRGI
jgi:hypothetical protein